MQFKITFCAVALLSVFFKVYVSRFGLNWDMGSWFEVSNIVLEGKSVYAETTRYNYGPVWGYVLACLRWLQLFQGESIIGLHAMIALFLSIMDIGLAVFVWVNFSFLAACIFLLNPISILLTGFHSQFDGFALVMAALGVYFLKKEKTFYPGIILIGLSLSIKHILIYFPLWFLFIEGWSYRKRVIAFFIPYFIFLSSFIPFVFDPRSRAGVIDQVFINYWVNKDGFFPKLVELFFPKGIIEILFSWIPVFGGVKFLWLCCMLVTASLLRHARIEKLFLWYLVAMVAFSISMANQYLAIPLMACCVFWKNPWVLGYFILGTFVLLGSDLNVGYLPSYSWARELTAVLQLKLSHPVAFLFIFLVGSVFLKKFSQNQSLRLNE